ncbi:Alpha/Beta hydrolase protein [Fusarium redolens]|uniref:Alpha/Beta hydrolase protein n=1 Tax=Fusarium redolens TaxID=48865 RepID=A0A9P9FYQ9_FUSRE|nr:Alpha/Beta hydrolase protein [Fusarium redolens]KAH7224392.1 Alpha/Beta hydrolase protein [Fusarium redolens]
MALLSWCRVAWHACVLICRILLLVPSALYYTVPSNRPHRYWTLHQALGRKLMFNLMQFYTSIRLITTMPTERKDLGTRYISIAPASDRKLYRGPLKDEVIQPGTVRAVWYPESHDPSCLSNMASGEYLLHFHGGGYVLGSPLPLDSGYFAGVFAKYITPKVLFAGYRLTCVPEGRFPAALQDAVTAYLHILSMGVPPENVIISGDSAGGHLVISLLRYISEHLVDTPSPKAALLWSPWINIAGATPAQHVLRRKNYDTDYLPADFAEWATESFAPEGIIDRHGPYVTLKGKPFRTKTKLWAHVGDAELLYDEVFEWAHDMREAGNDVTLRIEHGAPHDIVESGHINGFRKEGEEAAKAVADWLQQ